MKIFKTLTAFAFVGLLLTSFTTIKDTEVEIDSVQSIEYTVQTPNIVEVAANNKDFTTLVAAVKAADLVEALSGKGPFTVFAPTNAAFAKLPSGTVGNLLKSENKKTLTSILTYHVVSGKFEAAAVIDAIKKNKGKFTVDTLNGGQITLSLNGGNVILTDANGGSATVVIPNVAASNGVIHAIDSVVMPKA
jgi:uncharacterized surface protein with fasciclin (FAS1) repeats